MRRGSRMGILIGMMKILLAHVGGHSGSKDGFDAAVTDYLGRCLGFARCTAEGFRSESAVLERAARPKGRTTLVLLDGRGRQMSSEAFAAWLGAKREQGTQEIVFAIGPADGWTDAARGRAQLVLSLGQMTLAHGLARVVMAEQIYRAVTILAGHPYHRGH
jgi:23S rRNA (pseudouridine1915-N3)-methyltransferase